VATLAVTRSEQRLYLLAMDHRGTFAKGLFGIEGNPSDDERGRIADAKSVIFEGFEAALAAGAPRDAVGLLVDEQFAAEVARTAGRKGIILAMPAEASGPDEFEFAYGDDFGAHIEAFDPAFVKVLLRYNPLADQEVNRRQTARLLRLSQWLRQHDRRLLLELLVPATQAELVKTGGVESYDHRLRPQLGLWAIAEMQAAGVEPAIWKIEGIDRRDDCERIAAQARRDERDDVRCVVLGRAADQGRVEAWLGQAAGVEGFCGFAIGRTIWFDALRAMLAGEIDRAEAAARIASSYLRSSEVYEGAAAAARS
jgi:myo-inositol catabolism protein IolC